MKFVQLPTTKIMFGTNNCQEDYLLLLDFVINSSETAHFIMQHFLFFTFSWETKAQ